MSAGLSRHTSVGDGGSARCLTIETATPPSYKVTIVYRLIELKAFINGKHNHHTPWTRPLLSATGNWSNTSERRDRMPQIGRDMDAVSG